VIGIPVGPLRIADGPVAVPLDGHLLRPVDDHHGAGDEGGGQPDDRGNGQIASLAHPRLQRPYDGHVSAKEYSVLKQFPAPSGKTFPWKGVKGNPHKLIIGMHEVTRKKGSAK